MKSVLALEHGLIPPIRKLDKLNPNGNDLLLQCGLETYDLVVDLKDGRLHIVQKTTQWPEGNVRRASVNSFGYGGANAHTILEAIDHLAPDCGGVKVKSDILSTNGNDINGFGNAHADGHVNGFANGHPKGLTNGETKHDYSRERLFVLPFSAHNEKSLKSNVAAIRERVDDYDLVDLSYTLGCRRSNLMTRTFAIAKEGSVADALDSDKMPIQKALASQNPVIGFVFTGRSRLSIRSLPDFMAYMK